PACAVVAAAPRIIDVQPAVRTDGGLGRQHLRSGPAAYRCPASAAVGRAEQVVRGGIGDAGKDDARSTEHDERNPAVRVPGRGGTEPFPREALDLAPALALVIAPPQAIVARPEEKR